MFWPGDIWQELDQMDHLLREVNATKRMRNNRVLKEVTNSELPTFLALLVGACNQPRTGRELWDRNSGPRHKILTPLPNFREYMSHTRFVEIRSIVTLMMHAEEGEPSYDDWWKVHQFVDRYNSNRQILINSSAVCILDESMTPFVPR